VACPTRAGGVIVDREERKEVAVSLTPPEPLKVIVDGLDRKEVAVSLPPPEPLKVIVALSCDKVTGMVKVGAEVVSDVAVEPIIGALDVAEGITVVPDGSGVEEGAADGTLVAVGIVGTAVLVGGAIVGMDWFGEPAQEILIGVRASISPKITNKPVIFSVIFEIIRSSQFGLNHF